MTALFFSLQSSMRSALREGLVNETRFYDTGAVIAYSIVTTVGINAEAFSQQFNGVLKVGIEHRIDCHATQLKDWVGTNDNCHNHHADYSDECDSFQSDADVLPNRNLFHFFVSSQMSLLD